MLVRYKHQRHTLTRFTGQNFKSERNRLMIAFFFFLRERERERGWLQGQHSKERLARKTQLVELSVGKKILHLFLASSCIPSTDGKQVLHPKITTE